MAESLTIITNNVPRPIILPNELTEKQRAEFDYIDWQRMDDTDGEYMPDSIFVEYKGEVYDLTEGFEWVDPKQRPELAAAGWSGICTESFFSAVLVRDADDDRARSERVLSLFDPEWVVMGRCYA